MRLKFCQLHYTLLHLLVQADESFQNLLDVGARTIFYHDYVFGTKLHIIDVMQKLDQFMCRAK